jgi:hypothetical protein
MSAATAVVTPVIFVDDNFVLGVQGQNGQWSLPMLPIPPKHSIATVLKKFFKDSFDLDVTDLVNQGAKLGFIYATADAEQNRFFQHPFIVTLSREQVSRKEAPEGFGMLPLDQIEDAPYTVLMLNHQRIIFESKSSFAGVGK